MDVLVNVLVGLGCLLVGYLLGSFPTGVFIGKVFFKKDPRDYYSHNSGGTNTGRVLGKKIGLLTIIIDSLKAGIALYAAWAIITFTPVNTYLTVNGYFLGVLYYWLAGFGAALGHCYSIFLRFQGGKAVSCFVGLCLLSSWGFFIVVAISFFGTLKASKYVSLSSIIMSISVALTAWIFAILGLTGVFNPAFFTYNAGMGSVALPVLGLESAIVLTILSAIIVIRHHGNIARLKEGTESKITWMK